MSGSGAQPSGTGGGTRHAAGAYDVRNVIAGLIGFYGVVLVVVGLVGDSAAEQAKTGGVDANLWAGIAMLVFAACVVATAFAPPSLATWTEQAAGFVLRLAFALAAVLVVIHLVQRRRQRRRR